MRAREKGSKVDVRGKREDMLGSLRGRRSEEMTQSNTSFPQGSEVPFESEKGEGN